MDVAIKALVICMRDEIVASNKWLHSLQKTALSQNQIADMYRYLKICEANICSFELAIEILRRENK